MDSEVAQQGTAYPPQMAGALRVAVPFEGLECHPLRWQGKVNFISYTLWYDPLKWQGKVNFISYTL